MAVLPTLDNLRALLQRVVFVPIVYGFISLLPMFLTGWENSDRLADRLFSTIRSKENMFDFIVVGGGTAGALVANRLAEHYKVLLLEAGGTPMPFQTIPALALKFLNHPQTDWSHKTVPQRKACLNSINQQSSWSAGRGLGGTSNINFMTHVRGHPLDYDSWAEITGDLTWSYKGVLPYFKRCETFSGTSNDPEARGHDGELRIRKPSYIGLSEDWVRAGQEIGYPFVDLNGRHEEGFGILQYPIYKGIRQSTYASFLLPMHKSPRLIIRRYALVRKILFRDMNNMAYGVEYVRHGKIETAIATKEVILSAGTLGTSKLLMLSGVGPRQHLEELGIPVRSELPVGMNLQDHLAVHLGPFFIKEPKSFLFDRDVTPENIVRWLFLGTGPITTTGYQGAASIASSIAKSNGEGNWPDLHLILHGQAIHQGYTDAFAYAYSLQEDELMQYYNNAIGRDSFHIYVVGSRPTSKGQVLLSGASISDPLVINPRYLDDAGNRDFKVLLEGVKTALNIANTSMFQRLGTEFTQAKLPGCQEFELGTDEYWECYIRRFTLTMHNPVGTATMGLVVESNLKVKGTRGLRVVDASVQPTLVSTGSAASTLMIAEKGVDFILSDYGIPDRDQDLFDVIFGRNGFFKRNPILKILQREFDTLNPIRALFKPFITVSSAVRGSRSAENEAKERFTRNGRLDNPLLQVISTVFGGNSNYNQGDKDNSIVAESENFGDSERKQSNDPSSFQRRSTENFPINIDGSTNVISKNQWVLQHQPVAAPVNNNQTLVLKISKKPATSSSLKITELYPPGKKKGGKRYALLQKILKEIELNETLAKLPKTTHQQPSTTTTKTTNPTSTTTKITSHTSATTISTTKSTTTTTTTEKSTVKPVVEIVTFEKPIVNIVNISENEIISTETTTVSPLDTEANNSITNSTNDSTNDGVDPVAKPIGVSSPSPFGILPNTSTIYVPRSTTPRPSPLAKLFESLNSFQTFVNALTAKDRLPPFGSNVKPPIKKGGNLFSISPSQNIFHPFNTNGYNYNSHNKNTNIFSFLTPISSKPSKRNQIFGTSPPPQPTSGPFHFLFPFFTSSTTTSSPPTTVSSSQDVLSSPTTVSDNQDVLSLTTVSSNQDVLSLPTTSNDLADAVGFGTSDNYTEDSFVGNGTEANVYNTTTIHQENENRRHSGSIFSSWFQSPPKNSMSPISSWFKPFEKPVPQQSHSSWFKPFNNDKSSTSSWFKPFNFNNDNKATKSSASPSPSAPSNSWFNPFSFNNPSQPRTSATTTPDPLGDLFELILGGLKKNERRAVFRTLNTMLEAGEGLADLLGLGGVSGSKHSIGNQNHHHRNVNFFEKISKGKRNVQVEDSKNSTKKVNVTSDSANLLKSLLALNEVIRSHHNSTTRIVSSASSMSDDSLEDFLTTYNNPLSPSSIETSTDLPTTSVTTSVTTEINEENEQTT